MWNGVFEIVVSENGRGVLVFGHVSVIFFGTDIIKDILFGRLYHCQWKIYPDWHRN